MKEEPWLVKICAKGTVLGWQFGLKSMIEGGEAGEGIVEIENVKPFAQRELSPTIRIHILGRV
jgi:hypothetical protein